MEECGRILSDVLRLGTRFACVRASWLFITAAYFHQYVEDTELGMTFVYSMVFVAACAGRFRRWFLEAVVVLWRLYCWFRRVAPFGVPVIITGRGSASRLFESWSSANVEQSVLHLGPKTSLWRVPLNSGPFSFWPCYWRVACLLLSSTMPSDATHSQWILNHIQRSLKMQNLQNLSQQRGQWTRYQNFMVYLRYVPKQ